MQQQKIVFEPRNLNLLTKNSDYSSLNTVKKANKCREFEKGARGWSAGQKKNSVQKLTISPSFPLLLLSHPPWNKLVNCSVTKAAFPSDWLRSQCYCLGITSPMVTVLILARVEKSINRSCRSRYWPWASPGRREAISVYWKIIYHHNPKASPPPSRRKE